MRAARPPTRVAAGWSAPPTTAPPPSPSAPTACRAGGSTRRRHVFGDDVMRSSAVRGGTEPARRSDASADTASSPTRHRPTVAPPDCARADAARRTCPTKRRGARRGQGSCSPTWATTPPHTSTRPTPTSGAPTSPPTCCSTATAARSRCRWASAPTAHCHLGVGFARRHRQSAATTRWSASTLPWQRLNDETGRWMGYVRRPERAGSRTEATGRATAAVADVAPGPTAARRPSRVLDAGREVAGPDVRAPPSTASSTRCPSTRAHGADHGAPHRRDASTLDDGVGAGRHRLDAARLHVHR